MNIFGIDCHIRVAFILLSFKLLKSFMGPYITSCQ